MSRIKDREAALVLRKKGASYSQIKQELGIPKSTLSGWLKNYPLSEERIRELRDNSQQRIERCRETKRKKKEKRLEETYKEQKKVIFPLTKREFYLGGLFLYWGEGSKASGTEVAISNTDPAVINFFIDWTIKGLNLPKKKIKIQLQLYQDMDPEKEIGFWSKSIDIPICQFTKPYIKKSSSVRINHKGSFGHGTCNARLCNTRTSEKILMGIKNISDKYKRV
jgi:hypothetical protein